MTMFLYISKCVVYRGCTILKSLPTRGPICATTAYVINCIINYKPTVSFHNPEPFPNHPCRQPKIQLPNEPKLDKNQT